MTPTSLPALLRERTRRDPGAVAYTFVDYDVNPAGVAQSLSWAQAEQRALAVSEEVALFGKVGDRAAILAPEGLDYIAAFLGALHAGLIAVPLPLPQLRVHDERVSSALLDCAPAVILTTSGAAEEVSRYARAQDGAARPAIIQVDCLDLWSERNVDEVARSYPRTAYLQYTSGSTRAPTGVIVSHQNMIANLGQAGVVFFEDYGNAPPPGLHLVSWLPFHHDMGLFFSIFTPMYAGTPITFTKPVSFLQRPARWLQLLARYDQSFSCAPNFAFDLAARRTSDADMEGLTLSGVLAIINGAERVQPNTIAGFHARFARYGLKPTAIQPSYGLAEATLCVAAPRMGHPVKTVRFDYEHLTKGYAQPCQSTGAVGSELVSYGPDRAGEGVCSVRIVDPDTGIESPPRVVGEIWVHGQNVAAGYWHKPAESALAFGGRIVEAAPGTPETNWLRTGDLGAVVDGELFVMGRLKDMIIVDGRNHYPDDIEAAVREVTGGRAAAICVPDDRTERLVVIVELADQASPDGAAVQKYRSVKRDVLTAITTSHGLRAADLVLVPTGALPVTTSGKVRRSRCAELYHSNGFHRLDVSAGLLEESW